MKRVSCSKRVLVMVLAFLLGLMPLTQVAAAPAQQDVKPKIGGKQSESQQVPGQSGFDTTAEAAVLMDAVSGKVLIDKNMDKELPPASVTKIMTLLITMDALKAGKVKLTDRVAASENAWKMGGSQIYLEPGEELSMEEMLIAIAVGSANDACVAVAEHVAGSHEEFVELMNQRAKKLGLKHTHFVNSYGLPAQGHYTSAHDMARILQEALQYPEFKKLTSTKEYDLRGGDFKLWNTNKLLWWYRGTDGGKTGWTNEAKYCLASTVDRDGLRFIAVVLGTAEPRSHFRESMKLYNYGYAKYKAVKFAEANDKVQTLSVGKGIVNKVDVVTASRAALTVPKGEEKEVSKKVILPETVTAPIAVGDQLGEMVLLKQGEEVCRVSLVAKKAVEESSFALQVYRTFQTMFTMEAQP